MTAAVNLSAILFIGVITVPDLLTSETDLVTYYLSSYTSYGLSVNKYLLVVVT
jgi:hypothetical protein